MTTGIALIVALSALVYFKWDWFTREPPLTDREIQDFFERGDSI